jgi:hypothetical protein
MNKAASFYYTCAGFASDSASERLRTPFFPQIRYSVAVISVASLA